MKRGQITIFFILGLIIVAGISVIFMYRQTVFETIGLEKLVGEEALPQQVEAVKDYAEECAKSTAEKGLILLGMQGGYTDIGIRQASDKLVTEDFTDYKGTAYLYYKGQNNVPSVERVNVELSKYLDQRLSDCAKDDFPGLKVTFGKPVTKTNVLEKKVEFEINWGIVVKKDESEYKIKTINFDMPKLRLGELRNIVDQIVNKHIELKADTTCLSCLVDISAEKDIKIDVQTIDDDIFFMLTDEKSELGAQTFYTFILANKF